MATYAAIAGTCEAVVRLLRSNYDPAKFNGAMLDFQVYVANDFITPMEEGVSLFLYRIYQNGTNRTPAGRLLPDGTRQATMLPLDLHFLLTAWAKNATLPASMLNAYQPNVFRPDEGVDLTFTELSVEDMFRVWETMIGHVYQLSVPYQARMLEIESLVSVPPAGKPVQTRTSDMRLISN